MDNKSTSKPKLTDSLIEHALKKEKFPKPSASSLAFIRNFARNFKVHKNFDGDIRELVLN